MNHHWKAMCAAMDEAWNVHVELPDSIVQELTPTADALLLGTSHFAEHGIFNPIAAYGIEFGRREEDAGLPEISLKEYVERWPHKPEFFQYFERSNGYSTFAGILFRNTNVLISLQWTTGHGLDWFYVDTFNKFIQSECVSGENEGEKAIVVYSEYRQQAYTASQNELSWQVESTDDAVLLPLPNGYGMVGNWSHDMQNLDGNSDVYDLSMLTQVDIPRHSLIGEAVHFLQECTAGFLKARGANE